MNIAHLSLCAVFPLLFSLLASAGAAGGSSRASGSESLNKTSRVTKKVSRSTDTEALQPPYLKLPVFVHSRLPLVEKSHFSPTSGTGQEPLPHTVRGVLLPVSPTIGPPAASDVGLSVKTMCKANKMHVKVQKTVLGAGGSPSHLKLGTCQANRSTKNSLYFEYDLGLCGSNRTINNNRVTYSNTLQYNPRSLPGPIRRAAPFTLPVACYYNRYQYSYKIGYTPKMRMRKIFKEMRNRAKFILNPRNAQWERLSPSDHYEIGKPMYFEAEAPSLSTGGRLYVHSCHATLKKSHTSMPQFSVVENFGCMVESKDSRSRFIPYKNNAVRFSVDAFMFKGMTGQQLYMHCTMSVGPSASTPTAKSCNYDRNTGRWTELYGSDSVCACCDSNCSSAASTGIKMLQSPVTKVVSSRPWTIEDKVKPTPAPKRKTTTTTKKTTTKTTERRTTSQAEERRTTPVEKRGEELEWPFGGGGVKWVEAEGDERQVKGFAVVEEEQVTEPRRIFEEIFGLDK